MSYFADRRQKFTAEKFVANNLSRVSGGLQAVYWGQPEADTINPVDYLHSHYDAAAVTVKKHAAGVAMASVILIASSPFMGLAAGVALFACAASAAAASVKTIHRMNAPAMAYAGNELVARIAQRRVNNFFGARMTDPTFTYDGQPIP